MMMIMMCWTVTALANLTFILSEQVVLAFSASKTSSAWRSTGSLESRFMHIASVSSPPARQQIVIIIIIIIIVVVILSLSLSLSSLFFSQ